MEKKTNEELLKWLNVPKFSDEMLAYAEKYGLPAKVQMNLIERLDDSVEELLYKHCWSDTEDRPLCNEAQKRLAELIKEGSGKAESFLYEYAQGSSLCDEVQEMFAQMAEEKKKEYSGAAFDMLWACEIGGNVGLNEHVLRRFHDLESWNIKRMNCDWEDRRWLYFGGCIDCSNPRRLSVDAELEVLNLMHNGSENSYRFLLEYILFNRLLAYEKIRNKISEYFVDQGYNTEDSEGIVFLIRLIKVLQKNNELWGEGMSMELAVSFFDY